jgi:hypothetical protein
MLAPRGIEDAGAVMNRWDTGATHGSGTIDIAG